VPTSYPEIEAITAVIRELSLRVRDFGAKRWGKPGHVHGFTLRWGIMDERPGDVESLPNVVDATKSPVVLQFKDSDRGRRVYFAARWFNNTEKPGPWSDIESAFVP
jgi:hypothetical protein